MGFSPMDGFFMAVFLAVCISVAVLLRCLCYRYCIRACSDKFRHSNEDVILPRHATPTITPAGGRRPNQRPQQQQHSPPINRSRPVLPPSGTVFTIYTFPQQPSPELRRPQRSTGPPKYSHIPADSPPKYEDLFPITSKASTDLSSSSTAIEMEETQQSIPEAQPPLRDSVFVQAHTLSTSSSGQAFISAVQTNVSRPSSPSPVPVQLPALVPKEDPPLYDAIYPHKSGE